VHRRAQSPGLAEGLRIQLGCSCGSRHLAPEARYWRRAAFANGRRQASKVAIATGVLNRKLELGRPEYVRIA
jgi:hypothetical protein